jgi:hypothetical protein
MQTDAAVRERWLGALTWGFVGLGIVLRVFRYAMNFPLWGDESFVAVNFIARSYRDLLLPLDYGQICPLLFLWIERWIVIHLGFSEWTLRLFPLVCAVASVGLFRQVAALVVRGVPLLLAVAIFAVSFHPIRHAAEVKPYASDLLVALVLLAPALQWLRKPERTVWLWLLVVAAPVALALSHPAVFVAGGVSLGLARPVWNRGRWSTWVPFVLLQFVVAVTFVGLFMIFTRLQAQVALRGLQSYWAASFPPLEGPARLLRWLIAVHTGTMLAYPGGGRNGASSATFLAVVAGSVWLWRRDRRPILALLLAPLGVALVAAALRRYPYGNEARQMQFAAPTFCLLAGIGAAWLLDAVPWRRLRFGLSFVALLCLGGFALASLAGDLRHPYRFLYDHQARQFARRFWPAQAHAAELACLRSDFGVAERPLKNFPTAIFLCNQWIYSPQRRRTGGPSWQAVTPQRPLRCVLDHPSPRDEPQLAAWLARMQHSFDLRRIDRLPIPLGGGPAGPRGECLVIFELVPKAGAPVARPVHAALGLETAPIRR